MKILCKSICLLTAAFSMLSMPGYALAVNEQLGQSSGQAAQHLANEQQPAQQYAMEQQETQHPRDAETAGWYKLYGKWYYRLPSGANATGWLKSGGKWYFMYGSGAMATGWVQTGGRWYFLNQSGAMHTGWLLEKDKWYYLNASGAMVTGWMKARSGWFYLTQTGAMATGFLKADGNVYHFDPSTGAMSTGWVQHGGGSSMAAGYYYMRGSGVMATGWVLDEGKMYYLRDSDGLMLANTWKAQFQFDGSGAMKSSAPTAKARTLDPSKPMVALTFDDGPSNYTQQILNLLDKYNARATFFMVGNRVKSYPTAAKSVVAQGSEIGTHSWNHKDLTTLTDAEVRRQLVDSSNAIYDVAGVRPTTLRPPYGCYSSRVANICKEQGLLIVNWSVDPNDWKFHNAETVAASIMKAAKPGSIILCHDLYPSTVKAMQSVMPQLASKGYQMVTVSELFNSTGLHPGKVYSRK